MKKIVLPIDGSTRSQRTIAITKQIFHGQDAEITLLMVLPEPRYTDAQAERDRATIQANQELADFAKEFAGLEGQNRSPAGSPRPGDRAVRQRPRIRHPGHDPLQPRPAAKAGLRGHLHRPATPSSWT